MGVQRGVATQGKYLGTTAITVRYNNDNKSKQNKQQSRLVTKTKRTIAINSNNKNNGHVTVDVLPQRRTIKDVRHCDPLPKICSERKFCCLLIKTNGSDVPRTVFYILKLKMESSILGSKRRLSVKFVRNHLDGNIINHNLNL